MEKTKTQKINEEAYFLVDIKNFQNTITPYDSLIANQTIIYDNDFSIIEELPGLDKDSNNNNH